MALVFYAFALPVVVARPFNVGPRSRRAAIPTIITQLVAGAREVQLGGLQATRDFTFVEDMPRLLALASLEGGEGESFTSVH
jgi:nucleoside-diphosphate-sugar epimerase